MNFSHEFQENLQQYHKAKPNDVLHSTGPYFLDDIYKRFKPATKSEEPENMKGNG